MPFVFLHVLSRWSRRFPWPRSTCLGTSTTNLSVTLSHTVMRKRNREEMRITCLNGSIWSIAYKVYKKKEKEKGIYRVDCHFVCVFLGSSPTFLGLICTNPIYLLINCLSTKWLSARYPVMRKEQKKVVQSKLNCNGSLRAVVVLSINIHAIHCSVIFEFFCYYQVCLFSGNNLWLCLIVHQCSSMPSVQIFSRTLLGACQVKMKSMQRSRFYRKHPNGNIQVILKCSANMLWIYFC